MNAGEIIFMSRRPVDGLDPDLHQHDFTRGAGRYQCTCMMSHEFEAKKVGIHARQGLYKMRSPAWKETYRNRCLERLRENRTKCHALKRRIFMQGLGPEGSDEDLVAMNGRGDSTQTSCKNALPVLSIDEIMEQEWKHLSEDTVAGGSNYIDSMVSLYEEVCCELKMEIHNDLKREEEHLLRMQEMLEAELQYEEDELCSAVESLTTDEVICPLCEK
ncbi:RPA-interacting protein [Elysia marginata]|uniref:RPA-interacting protein n=1 Tax=Elysia marginata TaxID=1093978 RepID=A0AAV4H9M5_9GAST|nr:RPA-interacting protein [Elysia marginata]